MSLGEHAVIVEPSRWEGDRSDLASRLAPVLRLSTSQIEQMLERGPVTVDADLDEGAARRLQKRLQGLGIAAVLRRSDEGADSSPLGSAPPPARPAGAAARPSVVPRPARLKPARDPTTPAPDLFELSGEAASKGGSRPLPERGAAEPAVTEPAAEEPGESGWGDVLPGLAVESSASERAERAARAERAEPVEQAEVDERSIDLLAEFEATARTTEAAPRPATPRQPASAPPKQPPSSGPPSIGPGPARPQPSEKRRSKPSDETAAEIESRRAFDSSLMSAALAPSHDPNRPPHAPQGFDDSPPHLPEVAALLSALAPGAGQIYNGEDDEALDYGLKAFLIKPWYESVIDAKERAEKIATYWAPPPEKGSTFRAIRYLVVWWICVAFIAVSLAFLISWGWEMATREPAVAITVEEIAVVHEDARTEVRLARIEAMRALSQAQLDIPEERFTMSDEERGERLFIIGYRHCEDRNYSTCEAIMRRVTGLRESHIDAFRLQAWASTARGGKIDPMPDVGPVPTLSDFEAAVMSDELGLPAPKARGKKPSDELDSPTVAPDAGEQGDAR